jgi:hypothetical protein
MIRLGEYVKRMKFFDVQFDLCRRGVNIFAANRKAVDEYVEAHRQSYATGAASYAARQTERHPLDDLIANSLAKAYASHLKTNLSAHIEFADNRIAQYELILRGAFFEEEIKEIHRHILFAEPKLLKPDRKIDLGRIVTTDYEQLIEEEIEAEVRSLDRQSVEKRAEYFQDRFKLKWATGQVEQEVGLAGVIGGVSSVLDIRNKILHETPDAVITAAVLQSARLYLTYVPNACTEQAAKLYPSNFSADEAA